MNQHELEIQQATWRSRSYLQRVELVPAQAGSAAADQVQAPALACEKVRPPALVVAAGSEALSTFSAPVV